METREYRTMDKSEWKEGPWTHEPDKVQWTDEATGLPCLIVRNRVGALCGYVGVPVTHAMYGMEYSDLESVDVHGGLTFSGRCRDGDESESICHVPGTGETDDVWWLGFDTAHAMDFPPAYTRIPVMDDVYERGLTYRDIEYVKAEVRRLALQLTAL